MPNENHTPRKNVRVSVCKENKLSKIW